jgi:hypothetical protein
MRPRSHIARLARSANARYQQGDYQAAASDYRSALALAEEPERPFADFHGSAGEGLALGEPAAGMLQTSGSASSPSQSRCTSAPWRSSSGPVVRSITKSA